MPNTRKILIVDDDPEMREALTEQLSLHEEFEAIAAENGGKGVQAAKAGQINLVIMDVGLPRYRWGAESVRILRKNGFKAPIIMLTGHYTDFDTILGSNSAPTIMSPSRSALPCEQPSTASQADIGSRWRQREESFSHLCSLDWPSSKDQCGMEYRPFLISITSRFQKFKV